MSLKCSIFPFTGSEDVKLKFKFCHQTILILFCLAFLVPIVVACSLYRSLVSTISRYLAPELSHILPLHASLYLNQNVQADIWSNILLRFKIRGQLDLERVRARFVERFVYAINQQNGKLLNPELQQYAWKWAGYHFWRWEYDFKIDDHIVQKTDHPAQLTSTEVDELEIQFLKTPFGVDKSPWQILIIDNNVEMERGNEDGHSFLVLFKFHHSLSDGKSLFDALMKCADEQVPALKPDTHRHRTMLARIFHWATFPVQASYEFAKLWHHKSAPSPWGVDSIDQSASKVTRRHVTRSNLLDKAKVKKLGSHHGVSFTAVLLAAISGGIRSHLLRSKKPNEIPECMVCEVPVPVEIHPEGLTNEVCVVSFILPVGCPDIRQRIQFCQQSVSDRKSSTEPELTHFLFNLFTLLPDIFPKIPYKFPPIALSVFPGPVAPVKFDGQELFEMSYVLLSVPVVFAISILTYDDGLQFFCTGDDRIFTHNDIKQIVSDIEEELDNLEQDAKWHASIAQDNKLNPSDFLIDAHVVGQLK